MNDKQVKKLVPEYRDFTFQLSNINEKNMLKYRSNYLL